MPPGPHTAGRRCHLVLTACAVTLAACQPDSQTPELDDALCEAEVTPISAIQGEGFQTPMPGRQVTVRGIVTHTDQRGFYLESTQADASPETSEGLFVQASPLPGDATPGSVLAVQGMVDELGKGRDSLTSLVGLAGIRVCNRHVQLPLTQRRLPMNELQREASEGMRIEFEQVLVVADVYRLSRGEILVSPERLPPSPTEVTLPGDDARERAWLNSQQVLPVQLPRRPDAPFPAGTGLARLQGVLGHDGRRLELLLQDELNPILPARAVIAEPAEGDVRVLSLNLHNYFNGDGTGGGFLADRGAGDLTAFDAQRRRLVAALRWIRPHITAVVELENDGFGPLSASADFLEDLEQATGHPWQAVNPGVDRIGTDLIRVGLFYRPDLVQPSGEAQLLEERPFQSLSRIPLAQVFLHRPTAEPFVLAVNHFKSKGSCPDAGADADNRDGQTCWNRARVAAADAVARWTRELAGADADGRILLMGDFNAYRLEDPVRYLLDSGFEDLTAPAGLGHEYTYIYFGQSGSLDYAFASAALRPFVWSAQVPHINAGYPPDMPLEPEWLGFSDHDPVVVDLRFNQSSTRF